jgi:hypothetical protein
LVRRLLTSLAAALLLAGCTGASPTPTPSVAPSALPAGAYTSRTFQPSVSYTLPAGWDNPTDAADYFELVPAGSEIAGIHLFRDPKAMSQAADCPASPEPGVGGTSSQLAAWIRARPGLAVGDPRIVTVGGLRGIEIDVAIADGWAGTCPFANGLPAVPLFVGKTGGYQWVVAGSERLRLSLLDVPGGGTVVVDVDAFDGSVFDSLVANAAPIVDTFTFAAS